ncbi:MAG TPA: antibiotic biosynthesis monooxygenase [Vicinamibacterales bacterium]
MPRWLLLIVGAVLLPSAVGSQTRSDAPAAASDAIYYAVSYVETTASSTEKAAAALKQYRDGSRAQDGFVRAEFFEQLGRPGHFAIVETWRDQKSFDARDGSAQKRLTDALESIRVSGYDQRPYKTLSVGTSSPPAGRQIVYVISHVDVTPNPQVPVLLRQLAEASRQEAGNLRFDVLLHTMRSNHFTVIEAWRNQQALDAHVAAPHTKQYRDTLQPLTGSPLDERTFRIVD